MREQILSILWAQFRVTRNHFPRTSFGTVLSWSVSALWYLVFVVFAVLIARALPSVPDRSLVLSVSIGLLATFAYMIVVPLITASAGWSLQLDKLIAFPISNNTLFLIEVVLRATSSPEMLILLAGGFVGLLLRGDIFPLAPLFLLLFLSLSLFLQLAVRDFLLHSFSRSRFREIISLLLIAVGVIPQMLVRQKSLSVIKPYLLTIANGRATPWHLIATQSIGQLSVESIAAIICWNAIAIVLARRQFMKSLRQEDSFRPAPIIAKASSRGWDLIGSLTHPLPDPFGALVEKELRSLIRMPRFRILFGMACIFSILIFLPMILQSSESSFMRKNAVPVTSIYGLTILGTLLMNIFGFDRGAVQVYFATPLPISTVIRAKNLSYVIFVAVQTLAIPLLSVLFRVQVTWFAVASGFLSAGVVTVFLLSTGNLLSVYMPRPIDPRSSFRRESGGKVQLWLLLCTFGMFLLVGVAFLARWATDRDWVLLATLAFEFVAGLVFYRVALDSAIDQAISGREQMVTELSKNASPLSS